MPEQTYSDTYRIEELERRVESLELLSGELETRLGALEGQLSQKLDRLLGQSQVMGEALKRQESSGSLKGLKPGGGTEGLG